MSASSIVSSVVVAGAADVVVNDRRLVRGGCGPFAIEIVLQDGGDRAIGVRTDLECPCTGCRFRPIADIGSGASRTAFR